MAARRNSTASSPTSPPSGKIIGGGLPVGAYGGPSEIMNLVAPLGPMYQAGTLSGNPLAMAAGLAMLCAIRENREVIYSRLEKLSRKVHQRSAGGRARSRHSHDRESHRLHVHLLLHLGKSRRLDHAPQPVTPNNSARFHRGMLDAGVWLPPSQFEAMFLSAAHTEQDVEQSIAAAREALASGHCLNRALRHGATWPRLTAL